MNNPTFTTWPGDDLCNHVWDFVHSEQACVCRFCHAGAQVNLPETKGPLESWGDTPPASVMLCRHEWKVTVGLYKEYKDCIHCKKKWENLHD